jgi:hypothetical protein
MCIWVWVVGVHRRQQQQLTHSRTRSLTLAPQVPILSCGRSLVLMYSFIAPRSSSPALPLDFSIHHSISHQRYGPTDQSHLWPGSLYTQVVELILDYTTHRRHSTIRPPRSPQIQPFPVYTLKINQPATPRHNYSRHEVQLLPSGL